MARFKVMTPEGVSFGPPGVGYDSEMEALGPIGAEIVEIPPGSEEDFIRAARDADALYVKARRITKPMPWSPSWARAAGVRRVPSTSKPQPSSETMAWTISRRRWSTTLAVRAPECFAEFVSASWMMR